MADQNQKSDLKFQYRRTLEISAVIALAVIIALFMISKKFESKVEIHTLDAPPLEVKYIPPTSQPLKKEEIPPKPTIPVVDPEAEMAADIEIPVNIFNVSISNPPPPPDPSSEIVPWVIVEIKPQLIGGTKAIMDYIIKHNLYPEMAFESGVTGKTLIEFSVDTEGNTINVHVVDEDPEGLGFGEAGVKVMKAMRFSQGVQRDNPVIVKSVRQLIKFELE